jgi:two-component system OmpR family response regulator
VKRVESGAVYALTAKGIAELSSGRTSLSASDLSVLVLLDGTATAKEVQARAGSVAPAALEEALQKLLRSGYIAPAVDVTSEHIDAGNFFAASASESEAAAATLKAQGYFVKFARGAIEPRKLAEGQRITVLVVEDDAQLAKLVRTYFQMDGIDTRLAANREEINAGLRQAPKPDAILLDVMLPDIDGFDVLARVRQHDAVKDIPVIMMTAKATREAVLKGLQRGAAGYVTKPFHIEAVLAAVKTVLGLHEAPARGKLELK